MRLCVERLGVESYTHVVEPGFEIPGEKLGGLQEAIGRLARGEPLQYVLGFEEFCGRRFRVGPGVLIPRPETEELVRVALKRLPEGGGALDLCTGSGCIAWTLALDRPGASVVGVDLSEDALAIARCQFGEPPQAAMAPSFIKADVLEVPDEWSGAPLDVITANPPYIRESERTLMHANVLEHEPALALFVPDSDPLRFYRAVALWAGRFLRPGGFGIVEINEELGAATAAIFAAAGFGEVKVAHDFRGKERFVSFVKRASVAL